jgi:TusA-related sulfurtransferase
MDIIDCFGDICPIPIIKIEKKLKTLNTGDEFMLVTDHSCTLESIKDKYMDHVTHIEEVMNGVWEVSIRK